MIIQCPHCFIDVSPSRDGTCPSCRKDTTVIDPAKADLLLAEFVDGEPLPPFCAVCGKASSAHIECGVRSAAPTVDGAGIWARFLGAFGGAVALTQAPGPKKRFALSVLLPVCPEHEGRPPLEPLFVDQRAYRLTFPVHKALHAAWSKR